MSTSSDQPPEHTSSVGFRPLDPHDESTLFQLIRAGREADAVLEAGVSGDERRARLAGFATAGRAALRKVIEAHLALVIDEVEAVATASAAEAPVSLGQLVQDGNLALVQAVERFDPSRGTRFATYARWMVRSALQPSEVGGAVATPIDSAARERRALLGALDRLTDEHLTRRDPIDAGVSIDFVRARAERARELAHGKLRHPSMRQRLHGTRPA